MPRIKETRDEQGNLHSFNDEPAVEYSNGIKEWYHHGKRHRDNGPATIRSNGDKIWYHHGELHRDDGPAVEYSNGNRRWYRHGKRHREDGPAIEYTDGYREWWIRDVEYTFHDWLKMVSLPEEEKLELLLKE